MMFPHPDPRFAIRADIQAIGHIMEDNKLPNAIKIDQQRLPETVEYGFPVDWQTLLEKPSERAFEIASEILARVESPEGQDRLVKMAQKDLHLVGEFFAACPALEFFFVWGEGADGATRCGPSKRRVRALLAWRGKRRRRVLAPRCDPQTCKNTWVAVTTILNELSVRKGVWFCLYWRLFDEDAPQLCYSGTKPRQWYWDLMRMHLPPEFREGIPVSAPPTIEELERSVIEAAPPSTIEPDPAKAMSPWHFYQRHNPTRRPDWRWNRAHALVRNGRYFSRLRDDEETGNAVRFLRRLLKRPQDPPAVLEASFPQLFAAHAVYARQNDMRLELEARLLAGQSDEDISENTEIPPSAISAYESVYFNVRDRLNARTYLRKKVIGLNWAFQPWHLLIEGLVKLLAYHGGPVLFDAVWSYLRDDARHLSESTDKDVVHDPLAESLSLLIRAASLPVKGKHANHLIANVYDLAQTFSKNHMQTDILGSYAKITAPFDGGSEVVDNVATANPNYAA